jgi:protein required for attachment to host cells
LNKSDAKTLWALVTDGGLGRVLELTRETTGSTEIEKREAPARHLTPHELKSDARGRNYKGQGPAGHAVQPRTDAHDDAETQFISGWVELLDKARVKKRFDQLLLVADPRTLGRLREHMGKALQQCVIGEYDHNLTHTPSKALEKRLRALAGWE